MATSTMRFSSSAIVNATLGDAVVSSHDAVIAQAASKYQLLFKVELNANPTKVIGKKAEGQYQSTITNLGGCGAMRVNTKTGLSFFSVNSMPMVKDTVLGYVPNTKFTLPLYHVTMDVDPIVAAQNEALAKLGIATIPTTSVVTESVVSADRLAAMLFAIYGANNAQLYFNDNKKDVFFSEETLDSMASEAGLLTVWFALDESSISPDLIDVYGIPTPRLNCKIIAAEFEAGKATYVAKPRSVAPAARLSAGLSALTAESVTALNAHGNVELSETFFANIEAKRDEFLASVGTGKKAHKEFKEALEASIAKGEWDKDVEHKLYAIARRGLNPHYTMKNHDTFVAKLRAEAGNDVVIVKSAPIVVEEVAAPNVASNPAATVDEDEDEDEDFGFVPNIPILPNKTEDDDVNIVI
jgi:hypothetical protein